MCIGRGRARWGRRRQGAGILLPTVHGEARGWQRRAAAASKDTVKGLRSFDVTEVIDGTAYARWLWQNDREPLLAWMNDHARRCKHHVPGVVETRKERRAV